MKVKNDPLHLYIMDDLYAVVEFPYAINLPPSALHNEMYKILEKKVIKKLSNNCLKGIGHIKPGSIEIVKKTLGMACGSHFTGNMTFKLQIRCKATMPIKGQEISCSVIGKNDAGILARNFNLPYMLFVPRIQEDEKSDLMERVMLNSDILVTVSDSTLRAPSRTTTTAEYWVICDLGGIDTDEMRQKVLPRITALSSIEIPKPVHAGDVDRSELTNDTYLDLEREKERIEDLAAEYHKAIEKDPSGDLVLKSKMFNLNRKSKQLELQHCIIGIVINNDEENHNIQVLINESNKGDQYKVGKVVQLQLSKVYPEDTIVVYYFPSYRDSWDSAVDLWGDHIKYMLNINEMINVTHGSIYRKQLMMASQLVPPGHAGGPVKITDPESHVVSRAYYKMWEMYHAADMPDTNARIVCIAEAPGGFIQALLDKRGAMGHRDYITGVSITSDEGKGTWSKLFKKVSEYTKRPVIIRAKDKDESPYADGDYPTLDLVGGVERDDGQGNIYDEARVQAVIDGTALHGAQPMINEDAKADLVTADGGFPHDKTTTTEEMDTAKLILAEVLFALKVQKQGGSFILKIFDMATEFTACIVSILSYCYQAGNVQLYKPQASRHASSEKYIVCTGFNIDPEERDALIGRLSALFDRMPDNPDEAMPGFLVGGVTEEMKVAITHYNDKFMKKQMEVIGEGVEYGLAYCNAIRSGRQEDLYQTIRAKANVQYQNATRFRTAFPKH